MRQICSFQKLKCHEKDSVNVKLPMCDTLGFLRLSLVEGFHLAFCSEKLNNLLEILLYDRGYKRTAKNVCWVVFLVWNLPPGWKLGDGFFFFFNEQLYSCNITSKMIFHCWVQCPNTGRCGKGTDHVSLTHFLLCLGVWLCRDVMMFAEGTGTKETQLPSIFGHSKSRMGWLWGWSYSASNPSEQRGMDKIITYNYK